MLATSVQQWARRYVRMTQPARCPPHKRARVRAYFANGAEIFRVSRVVETLPALVHLSVFIFFTGLVLYLLHINHTVFKAVLCCVGVALAVYGCITLMPFFWHDSPYYSPLSPTAWLLGAAIIFTFFIFMEIITMPFHRIQGFLNNYLEPLYGWLVGGVEGTAAKAASGKLPDIDGRIVEWTIDALGEDDALENFFESIPGFYKSGVVENPRQRLSGEVSWKITRTLDVFLRRTLTSNSVPESVKIRRLTTCLNAAGEIDTSDGVPYLFISIIHGSCHGMPLSVETGHLLSLWDKTSDGQYRLYIQITIALIVASVRERDDRWIMLAQDCLGVPRPVLEDYLAHGDSLLLAHLIHIIRQMSYCDWEPINYMPTPYDFYVDQIIHRLEFNGGIPPSTVWVPIKALQSLSKFNIRNTLPRLQHDFCALWNDIILSAQNDASKIYDTYILAAIRHIHTTLHQGTDTDPMQFPLTAFLNRIPYDPSLFPLCDNPGHPSHSTRHTQEMIVREMADPPVANHGATSIAVLHRNSALPPIASSSLPVSRVDESSLHDQPAPAIRSSQSPSQLPPSALSDPAMITSTQATPPEHPATSSGPHTILAADTPVPRTDLHPSSSRTITPRHSTDHLPLSPPITPGMSFTSSPLTAPGNIPSTDIQAPLTSLPQTLPSDSEGLPPRNSGTTLSLISPQSFPGSDYTAALNVETPATLDDSQGLNN